LSSFVYIDTDADVFEMKIKDHKVDTDSYVISVKDILLDKNFNFIQAMLNTTKGDDFHGIMGLGERA